MPRQPIVGTCHICGRTTRLSFEHIPPEAAFNNRRAVYVKFDQAILLGPGEPAKGRIQQRGIGGYTLCDKCNNDTGTWYASRFVEWCYQGMHLLVRSEGRPSVFYIYHIYPLAVLKQILTMFFSVNSDAFQANQPDLVRFVLDKEAQYLPPQYRFFVYYNVVGTPRLLGFGAVLNTNTHETHFFSEITYPPFGYVMTLNSTPPDDRLFEITHFSRYEYDRLADIHLRLPTLPTHLATIPGDYRTVEQIMGDRAANDEYICTHPD